MKHRILLLCLLFAFQSSANAQQWVDTLYSIQTTNDVSYGSAYDFAGNLRDLTMDITVPVGDTVPACGRPLLVLVHGGGFISGTKSDALLQSLMRDFAKRGYVTASVNYRLGMFNTSSNVHCNITQMFNTPWDCMNMADSSEWRRAWYRGVQDVKGAIRYMIQNAQVYHIDPRNVFVAGESAGGFIALGVAYLDSASEKAADLGVMPAVSAPNAIYENTCIQAFGMDTSIASLSLSRPDLGSIDGDLHPGNPYTMKGCGNFYGALFYDLFQTSATATPPALYMYHQPNDLIVPYGLTKLFAGYAYCATTFGCVYIINRPMVYGSRAIKNLLDAMPSGAPVYVFDSTSNVADCAQQIANPALGGHSVDNYVLRSLHLAQLFAGRIETQTPCQGTVAVAGENHQNLRAYPNPSSGIVNWDLPGATEARQLTVLNATGQVVEERPVQAQSRLQYVFPENCPNGLYVIQIASSSGIFHTRVLLAR